VKIWDYVDPDKTENEIKQNNEPAIPTIAAAPIAPAAAPADPVALAADPAAPAALVALAVAPAAPVATPVSTGTATPGLLSQ